MAAEKRIVFMGTSGFAALILARLLETGLRVVAVYTQPDRAAGRGMELKASEVKRLALQRGLPVYQPVSFRDDADIEILAALEPDFLIVASYGLILPQKVLDVPRLAPINIHASLLPAWRGAAPVQYAVKDSWKNNLTGVSIMKMEKGMDTGPVYARAELAIGEMDSAGLARALAELGADLLLQVLPGIAQGSLAPVAQDHSQATYTSKLVKSDGKIDWSWPAARIHSLARAVSGWPGAQTVLHIDGREYPVLLEPGKIGEATAAAPGTISVQKGKIAIAAADSWYVLGKLRPQGKKTMDASAFFNGLRCGNGQVGTAR